MDSRDRLRKVNLDDRGTCKCEPNSLPVFQLETTHKQCAATYRSSSRSIASPVTSNLPFVASFPSLLPVFSFVLASSWLTFSHNILTSMSVVSPIFKNLHLAGMPASLIPFATALRCCCTPAVKIRYCSSSTIGWRSRGRSGYICWWSLYAGMVEFWSGRRGWACRLAASWFQRWSLIRRSWSVV